MGRREGHQPGRICPRLADVGSSLLFASCAFLTAPVRLVDLFCTPDLVPNFTAIKRHLLTYYSLLQSTHLTNAVLASLPLPDTLDPHRPIPLPSRLFTLSLLVRDTLALLIGLPFFIGPLLIHVPAYVFARVGARLAEDEEETQAQNKVVFGLLLLLLIYPMTFFFFWAFLRYTPLGALTSLALVVLIHSYHTKLISGECPLLPAHVLLIADRRPRQLRTVS